MDWVVSITALVALLIALYGAVLSTYTLVSSRRDKRRQVKVELSTGFLATGPDLSAAMLFIGISNPGHITVTLNIPGIQLPNRETLVFPDPPSDVRFPHELAPGKGCRVWTPLADLAERLKEKGFSGKVKLVGFCTDAVGTTCKGKSWKLNVDTRFD